MIEKQTNFGKISTKLPLPDLLDMQKQSFKDFLQLDVSPSKRELKGLQAAFEDVFPIEAPDGSMRLEFLKYEFGTPRYATPTEAAVRDSTYSAPLSVAALIRKTEKRQNERSVRPGRRFVRRSAYDGRRLLCIQRRGTRGGKPDAPLPGYYF